MESIPGSCYSHYKIPEFIQFKDSIYYFKRIYKPPKKTSKEKNNKKDNDAENEKKSDSGEVEEEDIDNEKDKKMK